MSKFKNSIVNAAARTGADPCPVQKLKCNSSGHRSHFIKLVHTQLGTLFHS